MSQPTTDGPIQEEWSARWRDAIEIVEEFDGSMTIVELLQQDNPIDMIELAPSVFYNYVEQAIAQFRHLKSCALKKGRTDCLCREESILIHRAIHVAAMAGEAASCVAAEMHNAFRVFLYERS
jgi:hypothetical protein